MGRLYAWTVLIVAALSACGGERATGPAPEAPPGIELTSSAFDPGGPIPATYTCEGDDTSPPLAWDKTPDGTKQLALLVEDPDAPGDTFVHWTVYGIPSTARRFGESEPPAGSREGETSFGDVGYGGPCPPEGDKAHRYVFVLYALRSELDLERGAKPNEVRDEIADHALARGRLVGTFKRG
jgi:Raf kinase inhibitor-like YbhB/YbcL family protein